MPDEDDDDDFLPRRRATTDDDDDDDGRDRRDRRPRSRTESVVGRLVEGMMSLPALTLGQRIGTDSESVVAVLDKIEAVIGPMLTGMLITSAGSMAHMPRSLRQTLVRRGVPRPVVQILNRLFEDVFEGIWAARRMRRADPSEPLTEEDVREGFKKTRERLHEKAQSERGAFMSAMGKVDPAKRAEFLRKAATLTGDAKKKYEYFRKGLAKEAWMVEQLADTETAEWFPLLEAVLDPPPVEKPPSPLAGLLSRITGKVAAKAEAKAQEIADDPQAAMREMASAVDQATVEVDDFRERRRLARIARGRTK
jgi:hypothetical protein